MIYIKRLRHHLRLWSTEGDAEVSVDIPHKCEMKHALKLPERRKGIRTSLLYSRSSEVMR